MAIAFIYFLPYVILLFCVSFPVILCTSNTIENETDRLALLEFKAGISHDPYNATSSWNVSRPFCQWEGVTCSSRHPRVTVLDLDSKGLVGSISPHIGNLSFLRTLLLGYNSFHGGLPEEFGRLFRLENIRLTNNSLTGTIPVNITLCSNLKNLLLDGNDLIGRVPTELGSLSKLLVLTLGRNKLTGGIPPSLGNLTSIKTLYLHANGLDGSIPTVLGNLKSLELLRLAENKFSGMFPSSLYNISTMESIIVNQNELVGNLPTDIGLTLPNLLYFDTSRNKLTGAIPPSFGNLTYLEALRLGENNLTGSIPSTLGNLKNLRLLALGQNKLFGRFPHIYNLSTLEIMAIVDNQLTGNLPDDIGLMLPNLQQLYAGGNQFSGQIPTSLFNCSRLQDIDIRGNEFVGQISSTIGNLNNLTYLAMGENHLGSGNPGDLNFINSLTNCTNLQHFGIGSNNFTGMLPTSITNLSNQLTNLYLYQNQISGEIPTGIENLQNLIILSLHANSFTGHIPTTIGNLQKLQILSLKENHLSGEIPSTLRNMSSLFGVALQSNKLTGSIAPALQNQNLKQLYISQNNFTGLIPPQEISLSSGLIVLDMSHNSLSGPIPFEVGVLVNLNGLFIFENQLSGEIPSTIGSCSDLRSLNLRSNFLNGSIPSSLTSLKGLEALDISHNNISGEIPTEMGKMVYLRYLNLSYNEIEGKVPTEGIFVNASAFSVSGNSRICGGVSKLGLPKCKNQLSSKRDDGIALKVTIGVLIFLVVLLLVTYVRKKPKEQSPSLQFTEDDQQVSYYDLQRVSYDDLYKATDGFSPANLVGSGSSGSVFKGNLNEGETQVAVKVLNLVGHGALKGFMAECDTLKTVRHRNLLKILTVCSSIDYRGNEFKALVFEYMTKGSLESWLHPSSDGEDVSRSLNFSERLNIAIDVASALDYLHNDCETPIVHCDLKPSNVLLDDELTARVADFGLAKFLATAEKDSVSTKKEIRTVVIRGTIGYIPPEYGMHAEVSIKGDMYSYGILLLEMFTGKRPTDDIFVGGLNLRQFSQMNSPLQLEDSIATWFLPEKNPHLKTKKKEFLTSVITLGLACSVDVASERSDIKDVLKELHSLKEAWDQMMFSC
ncbi:non-specific serine/threonine protein kinase [Ranunculus cassubicifolius]